MKITAEVSLYPLHATYGNLVLDFIKILQSHSGLTMRTNTMSTQVSGTWDEVMKAIGTSYITAFSDGPSAALVIKVFNQDLEMDWLSLSSA